MCHPDYRPSPGVQASWSRTSGPLQGLAASWMWWQVHLQRTEGHLEEGRQGRPKAGHDDLKLYFLVDFKTIYV